MFILILFTIDFVSIIFINIITSVFFDLFILEQTTILPFDQKYIWFNFIICFFLFYEKIYSQRFDFWREMKQIYKAVFYSFIAVVLFLSLNSTFETYSKEYLIFLFISIAVILPFTKRISKYFLFQFPHFKKNIKIVAKKNAKKILHNELKNNWYLGYKPAIKGYSNVLIYSKDFSTEELDALLKKYSPNITNIYLIPYLDNFDFSNSQIIDFFNIRLSSFQIENRLLNYKYVFIKSIVEKLLVMLLFPLILILHLFLYILIKLDSHGTILYKQKRLGKDGKQFSCYKYRTMYEDSDGILKDYLKKNKDEVEHYKKYHKYKNDPRITRLGKILRKSSLDELPQFFNVLRGDMNLIGPRPYMIDEKNNIDKINMDIILKVKPGITGLWQVNGRNKLSFYDRTQLDIWYIQNWSLWMDFIIFLKTLKVVLFRIGAK